MKFKPHEYQRRAINFILSRPEAVLLLDMGLGKTVITLTALFELCWDRFEANKVLVIAPLRVARYTWPEELAKWNHLKGLTMSVAVGDADERRAALKRQADIYVINRENVEWLIYDSGVDFNFDTLVVDELSSFKSHQAKRFKALMKVRPRVERFIGLTGTPCSNGLMDLWAQFRLADMGTRLGRFIGKYRRDYFTPDKSNGHIVYSYRPRPGAEDDIYAAVKDITVSMKGADYLKLPEIVYNDVYVKLSASEMSKYRELKDRLVMSLDGGEVTASNAAVLAGKLQQLANGAVYGDRFLSDDYSLPPTFTLDVHDRKLDALEDLIEAANGKPVLIAYWFHHDWERIQLRLHKRKTKIRKLHFDSDFAAWNEGELPIAAIHPASAGHGLNLQAGGSALIWFGLSWSLELYQQTNARLYRQGQKNMVVIHRVIAKNTIDERVLAALECKNNTQAALIDAVKMEIFKGGA